MFGQNPNILNKGVDSPSGHLNSLFSLPKILIGRTGRFFEKSFTALCRLPNCVRTGKRNNGRFTPGTVDAVPRSVRESRMGAMPAEEQSKILFVDDEENVLRSLQRLFIDEGYEIFAVTSVRGTFEVLRDNEIAAIVSDQRMPQMSGAEFLEAAKEIRPDSVKSYPDGLR